ncbi:MAG: YqeG family HAD IIIA-type phosphatase [Oscillospiraceae bacterium]|nr:YqeG family HAD IIIA-type phosphatase [Oscillospiraceae bacterium]
MKLLHPTAMFEKISEITPEILKSHGILALILDVDNTLAAHGCPRPNKDALSWLETMKRAGIKLVIASNNTNGRVEPFAKLLSLDYAANAMKPLPAGFSRISKRMGLPPSSFGVVGDQIFTDVLGGNLFGAKTFFVKPLSDKEILSIKLKRKIEARILKAYGRKENLR